MTIAVIYGSSRPNGNTDLLAEKVIQGIEAEKVYLRDEQLQPIIDMRHSEEGFQDRGDAYNALLERILPHETLIFSTPIYWYSVSGLMKNFIDRWSHSMRDSKFPEFKSIMASKTAYVLAVGGDEPYIKGLPMIQQLHHIFDFMGMTFGGYIIGNGNKPGDILTDNRALQAASLLNQKLKEELKKG